MEYRTSAFDPNVAEYVAGEFTEDSRYATYREKGSRSYLLIYTRAGRGVIESGGSRRSVGPGDLALLLPRQMHAYGTDPKVGHWGLQWIHFHPRPDWDSLLRWDPSNTGLAVRPLASDLAKLVCQNLTECIALDPTRTLNRRLVFNYKTFRNIFNRQFERPALILQILDKDILDRKRFVMRQPSRFADGKFLARRLPFGELPVRIKKKSPMLKTRRFKS
jgi:hypothetical protein